MNMEMSLNCESMFLVSTISVNAIWTLKGRIPSGQEVLSLKLPEEVQFVRYANSSFVWTPRLSTNQKYLSSIPKQHGYYHFYLREFSAPLSNQNLTTSLIHIQFPKSNRYVVQLFGPCALLGIFSYLLMLTFYSSHKSSVYKQWYLRVNKNWPLKSQLSRFIASPFAICYDSICKFFK